MRVASVPAGHAYVRGLGLADAGIRVLDDQPVPGAPAGRWWPPAMLDPDWIAAHRESFDVMHVHFGVESLSAAQLTDVLAALARADRPLVHTVHDLTHPQLHAQDRHLAQLALLVEGADALITLTPGAAREIASRFGRTATVVPHPAMRTSRALPVVATSPPIVGVHLRDLRPNIDGPGTVALLAAALPALPGTRGHVHLHREVRDEASAAAVAGICAGAPQLTLVRGPRPDDAALEAEISGLAVSLLPYRHGTHSGWVELCVDLGVPVALPALGHFAEQHPEPEATRAFTPDDPDSLATALAGLLALPHAVAGSRARRDRADAVARGRARDARRLAAAHLAVYEAVMGDHDPPPPETS